MLLNRRLRLLAVPLAAALAAATILASPGHAAVVLPVRGQPTTIASGAEHSVLIAADGSAWGTGDNSSGQLTGTDNHRTALAPLTGLPAGVRAKAVSAAGSDTVVLGSDGVAYGTGVNASNQLTGAGNRSTLTPLTGLPSGVKAIAVSASGATVVVLGDDGVAYGAGDNSGGQLTGTGGGTKSSLTAMSLPVRVVAVSAGLDDTLVLGVDGLVYGAGTAINGRLCDATTSNHTTLAPLASLPAGVSTTAISVGIQDVLLLGSNGVVYGCGYNGNSQLTSAAPATATAPTALAGMPGGVTAQGITASTYDTVVLGSNGVAYGAGYNGNGQLTGSDAQKTTLTPLSPAGAIGPLTEVVSSDYASVVRDNDGVVYGTGNSVVGQLTGTASRQALTPFAGQPLAAAAPPAVAGLARVGSRLAASTGDWSPTPTSFTYQWLRSGVPITGATGTTYAVTATDLAKTISVGVTATRTGFAVGLARSAATAAVARGPKLAWSPKKKPTIRVKGGGSASIGHKLRITDLTKKGWSPDATSFDYRWTRNGKHIKHATNTTYTLTDKDRGKKIRVIITANRTGYTTGTLTLAKKKVTR